MNNYLKKGFNMKKIRLSQLLELIKSDLEHFTYPLFYPNNIKLTKKNYIIAFLSVEFRLVLSYRIQNFFLIKDTLN